MSELLNILMPIFILIAFGFAFQRIAFPSENFWKDADKLTYFILMPILLIYKLANTNYQFDEKLIYFILTPIFAILIVTILLLLLNKRINFEPKAFTSMVQGSIRFNTYIFLSLALLAFGEKGLVLASIMIAFAIPLINIICVSILVKYTSHSQLNIKGFFLTLVKNPLILGCIIGISLNNFEIPQMINESLRLISNTALPLGLLSIGFSLKIKDFSSHINHVMVASMFKFLVLPTLIFIIASLFFLEREMIMILVLYGTLSTAPTSYILAKQMGGDSELMVSIITLQTLFSIIPLSIVLSFI